MHPSSQRQSARREGSPSLTSKEIAAIDLAKFANDLVGADASDAEVAIGLVQTKVLREIAYQFALMNERNAPITREEALAQADQVMTALRDREKKA